MGKARKKSKTAKKQQNRATKRLAKSFAKKLGVSEDQKPCKDKKNGIVVGIVDKNAAKAQRRRLRSQRRRQHQQKTNNLASTADSKNDRKDFERQQASLWEREMVVGWKRNKTTARGRRCRAKPNTTSATTEKCGASSAKLSSIVLRPASFAAKDSEKSTDQLLQETVQHVERLEGIGRKAPPIAKSSSFTAEAWSATSAEPRATPSNPWEALDEDENEDYPTPLTCNKSTTAAFDLKPPAFHFAPASFAIPSAAASAGLAATPLDPDL